MKKLSNLFMAAVSLLLWCNCSAQTPSEHCEVFPPLNQLAPLEDYVSIEEGKCFVKTSHTNDALMVQVVVKDPALQQKFLMQGLNLYLDLSGKKKQKYGVAFPKSNPQAMMSSMKGEWGEMDQQPSRQQQNNEPFRGDKPEGVSAQRGRDLKLLVGHMSFEPAVLVNDKGEYCIDREKAMISAEDENLIYTVSLPYDMLGTKINKKKKIAIGLNVEMPKQTVGEGPAGGMPPRGGGMGGPGGPGSGMRPDGGRPGGRGGEMPTKEAMTELTKAYNQWLIFTL